jgi:hypothetical protein
MSSNIVDRIDDMGNNIRNLFYIKYKIRKETFKYHYKNFNFIIFCKKSYKKI